MKEPKFYRKTPAVIIAMKWTGDNLKEIIDFIGLHDSVSNLTWNEYETLVATQGLKIFSPGFARIVSVGDYIIRDAAGNLYSCNPTRFDKAYEMVDA